MMKSFKAYTVFFQAFLERLKGAPWLLARNAFVCILALAVVDVVIGEYLLYKYVILATIPDESASLVVKFKQTTYESVVQIWQDRQKALGDALENNYENPFN